MKPSIYRTSYRVGAPLMVAALVALVCAAVWNGYRQHEKRQMFISECLAASGFAVKDLGGDWRCVRAT